MIMKLFKTRMLPLLVIFLCVIIPQLFRTDVGAGDIAMRVIYIVLFAIYMYLFIHCGSKLNKLKKMFENK